VKGGLYYKEEFMGRDHPKGAKWNGWVYNGVYQRVFWPEYEVAFPSEELKPKKVKRPKKPVVANQ
jgi:hypothetical protein